MDQNDTNQVTDQPQTDAAQADTSQSDQQQSKSDPAQQDGQQTDTAPQADAEVDATQTPDQSQDNASASAAQQPVNYVQDVGGDLIGLLDEIEGDENLIQTVADEMALDKENVKTILTGLLDKIDKGQVTAEELALIMAAPVVDELSDEQEERK
jgi:hypothetical protein